MIIASGLYYSADVELMLSMAMSRLCEDFCYSGRKLTFAAEFGVCPDALRADLVETIASA